MFRRPRREKVTKEQLPIEKMRIGLCVQGRTGTRSIGDCFILQTLVQCGDGGQIIGRDLYWSGVCSGQDKLSCFLGLRFMAARNATPGRPRCFHKSEAPWLAHDSREKSAEVCRCSVSGVDVLPRFCGGGSGSCRVYSTSIQFLWFRPPLRLQQLFFPIGSIRF